MKRAQQPQVLQTLRILWFAFLMTLALFTGIVFFLRSQPGHLTPAPELLGLLSPVLAFVAITITLIITFSAKIFAQVPNFATYTILRLALGEAVALFGFLLGYFGAQELVFLGFFGWALLLQLSSMPSDQKLREFEASRQAR